MPTPRPGRQDAAVTSDLIHNASIDLVIAVGSQVDGLTALAIRTGRAVGTVEVDMGNTACKVPFAPVHIQAVMDRGTVGKKRKSARC